MSDLLITDEAVAAAEAAMRGHDCHPIMNANVPHLARAALEAALPHLSASTYDLVGGLGYGLGRRAAAEDIAQAIEATKLTELHPCVWTAGDRARQQCADIARGFATRPVEPSEPLTHPTGPATPETAPQPRRRPEHHVTEQFPTHHIDQCGETEPFTRREYHMCHLSARHVGEHECRACDATWTHSQAAR